MMFAECQDGTWGLECAETCGHCVTWHPCNKENGACQVGCEPGWTGVNCDMRK